ncbi:10125_t:CDS:10 [Cetraspora pellucida]|uniref:10125_t:CDS:1 n=1 Tax=Cetraspora pellucida TaxID=1433469 RepID=A0ACA9K2W2_9GLOM|nr:10125_t:CDS:10 [Cetraspora pellucida]
MKFGKLLQTESVPEWRKKYIDYKGLKTKLEKVRQSHYVEPESQSPTTFFGSISSVCDSPISYEHSNPFQSFLTIKEEEVNNEKSSLEISKPNLSDPVRPPITPLKIKINSFRRARSMLTRPSILTSKSCQRIPIISVDTIVNQLEPDEVAFFEALDFELKKICEFYEEKESNAKEHFKKINQAYEDLKGYKNLKQSNSTRNDWASKLFKDRDNDSPVISNNDSPVISNNESSIAIDYKDARKRMKKAICEFYRGAEMLKNYRNINYAGFKKILEKFDMITRLNGSEIYMQKVDKNNFVKSKKLDTLMRDTEYIYTKLFGGKSRSHAIKKLRIPNRKHKTYYLPTIRSGIYIGLAALSLYNTLKLVIGSEGGIQQLQFYCGMILPMILLLIIGVAMYFWTKMRINYKFIFEFDPRNNLDFRQYIEIPSFMLLAVCFAAYSEVTNMFAIPKPYYSLILVLVMLAIVLCPFRIFYYNARRWFIYSLGRMVISPFVGIEFRDFIFADHLNSLSYSLVTLQLLPCFASQEICYLPISITPLAPILGSFGSAMRGVQCIRRYYDTKALIHLGNGGKYASMVVTIYMIFYWRYTVAYYADDHNKILISKILYIIVQIICTIYANIWDIYQDWSLLQFDSSNFLLRDELGYKQKWVYYLGMFNNTFIRLTWISLFIYDNFFIRFMIAFGEMLRRWQWDVFRIENEHVTNCQAERATKELKLPTIFDSTSTEKIQKDRTEAINVEKVCQRNMFSFVRREATIEIATAIRPPMCKANLVSVNIFYEDEKEDSFEDANHVSIVNEPDEYDYKDEVFTVLAIFPAPIISASVMPALAVPILLDLSQVPCRKREPLVIDNIEQYNIAQDLLNIKANITYSHLLQYSNQKCHLTNVLKRLFVPVATQNLKPINIKVTTVQALIL